MRIKCGEITDLRNGNNLLELLERIQFEYRNHLPHDSGLHGQILKSKMDFTDLYNPFSTRRTILSLLLLVIFRNREAILTETLRLQNNLF